MNLRLLPHCAITLLLPVRRRLLPAIESSGFGHSPLSCSAGVRIVIVREIAASAGVSLWAFTTAVIWLSSDSCADCAATALNAIPQNRIFNDIFIVINQRHWKNMGHRNLILYSAGLIPLSYIF